MDNIGNVISILSLDWKNGLIFVAALIIIAVWVIQKFDYLCSKLGIQTKRKTREEKQQKDIAELKRHAEKTDQQFNKIFECMDEMKGSMRDLSDQVKEMREKMDESDRSKLGDRVTQAYNFYRKKGQWTAMEAWAFNNMVTSYKNAGGDSWIDEVAVPASKTWEIIDE